MKKIIIIALVLSSASSCKKDTTVVTPPPPTTLSISSFTPTTAGTGATITITGTNFTGATSVTFGGVAAASFVVVNSTTITAIVATGATGNVVLTTPVGTASLAGFTFTTAPPVQKGLVIHHANTGQCYGKAIATDASDNFIIAELFQGSIIGKPFTSAGNIDALFAKHDKNGNIIWERTAGGAGSLTTPHGVKTDAAGNVFVTGYFGFVGSATSRTISFDTKNITSKSDYDAFLAKYNSGGTIQWALALGNTAGVTEDRAWDIAVDNAGNSYISGVFTGSVDFNPLGTTPRIITSSGTTNSVFIAKYDANGINQWATKVDANLGAVLTEAYCALDIDNAGNVFVGGNYRNSITIGSTNFTAQGNTDIFVASITQANGTVNWAKTFGGTGNDVISPGALRVNATGEPHFTGRFAGVSNMGGTTLTSGAGAVTNFYVTALNINGNTKWAMNVSTNAGQSGGHRVAFDATGNVVVTGWYSGTASVNGTPITSKNGSNSADVFLTKLSAAGAVQWLNTFGAVGYNTAGDLSISAGLAIDTEGNALITGKFYGADVDWDPSVTMELKISSSGMDDGFTAKYKPDGGLWQKP